MVRDCSPRSVILVFPSVPLLDFNDLENDLLTLINASPVSLFLLKFCLTNTVLLGYLNGPHQCISWSTECLFQHIMLIRDEIGELGKRKRKERQRLMHTADSSCRTYHNTTIAPITGGAVKRGLPLVASSLLLNPAATC